MIFLSTKYVIHSMLKFPEGFSAPVGIRNEKQFLEKPWQRPVEGLEFLRDEPGEYAVYRGKSITEVDEAYEKRGLEEERKRFRVAVDMCRAIQDAGGRALFVGGCVRDEVWGKAPKDIDIEVYGLDAPTIERVVGDFGVVKDVGKAFGILKLVTDTGLELDVSLPRTDSKIGEGHRGFEVKTDPGMSIREAGRRRDFTWNAVAKDPLTGEIFDPFGGIPDAQNRVLRVTDAERFCDDPLRVMRAAQFVGRFGLAVEPDSVALLRSVVPRLKEIAPERMGEEWKKLFLKSPKPSLALAHLMEWGVIHELYPEIAQLQHTPQEFDWHPEGDVWVHTMMVVDEAATVARKEQLSEDEAYELILAALCHDLGKPATTEVKEVRGVSRITSYGHEPAGVAPSYVFMDRLMVPKGTQERVARLVQEHISPHSLFVLMKRLQAEGKSDKSLTGAVRKLARRTAPATVDQLGRLVRADTSGRGPFPDPSMPEQFMLPFDEGVPEWLRAVAKDIQVVHGKPAPVVSGKELISENVGFRQGKIIGDMIVVMDELRDVLGWSKEDIIAAISEDAAQGKTPADILETLRARVAEAEEPA
jgi:tRNA nucleotidyltransferase (CCA-adding enzyme)